MRKGFLLVSLISVCSLLLLPCQASAQKRGGGKAAGGGSRFQALITSLESSKNPQADILAKKMRFFAKELKKDGKEVKGLQPYVQKMETAVNAGDIDAAERALMDAIGQAYNVEFWKEVTFPSVDGFKVYAYLSEPTGGGKHPIIVLVHGGEHGSSTSFQRHAFLFSKSGFATLAVDYRSSTKHGEEYKAASDPAGKEIDDVIAAVEYAAKLPSTNKVGLMGSSHGAFLGGNVITRSSIPVAANLNFGAYNYESILKSWSDSNDPVAQKKLEYWGPFLGDPPDYGKARSVSPALNVDKINIPVLLVHGKKDELIPYAESVNFADQLKKEKKKVTLKLFTDGPHGFIFRQSSESESAFNTTNDFFKRNLK
ncbi:MAG: S9 family peptidase [Candidatus Lindowbacteria bacterium]|nr:S9 family peptidase [Candidatus Lindowbacteria bacterium]